MAHPNPSIRVLPIAGSSSGLLPFTFFYPDRVVTDLTALYNNVLLPESNFACVKPLYKSLRFVESVASGETFYVAQESKTWKAGHVPLILVPCVTSFPQQRCGSFSTLSFEASSRPHLRGNKRCRRSTLGTSSRDLRNGRLSDDKAKDSGERIPKCIDGSRVEQSRFGVSMISFPSIDRESAVTWYRLIDLGCKTAHD
jgi:hypothetical protein